MMWIAVYNQDGIIERVEPYDGSDTASMVVDEAGIAYVRACDEEEARVKAEGMISCITSK